MRPASANFGDVLRARSRSWIATVACLLAAISVLCAALLAAPTANAASIATNASTTVGNNATSTISIPIATGLIPTAVSGQITAPVSINGSQLQAGTVVVRAGGQVVYSGIARSATFASKLTTARVANGKLVIAATYSVPAVRNDFCSDNSQQVEVKNVRVDLAGRQTAPTKVANFLTPGVNGVNVLLPANPQPDVIQAGLAAVGAATHVLDQNAQVRLSVGKLDPRITAIPGARVIAIQPGSNPVSTSITTNSGLPQLNLSGSGVELAKAASALGSPQLELAGAAKTNGLSQTTQPQVNLTRSFTSLGAKSPSLNGWGTQSLYVGVDQSAFGGGISDAQVRLVGTHSAVPDGATAVLNLYWNDSLIGSQTLGQDTAIDLTAAVPNSQLQSQNGLRVVLSAVPTKGNCTGSLRVLPFSLSLDSEQSQITATRGQTLSPGFARFPQALAGVLPVAIDSGVPVAEGSVQAGLLVASLQRAQQSQLAVSLIPVSEINGTSGPGLIVGATEATSNDLGAPLRLTEFRSISNPVLEFGVGLGVPYAALEGFSSGNRNLIMLGSWAPNSQTLVAGQATATKIAEYVYGKDGGWSSLGGDLLVAQPDQVPSSLDSNQVVPQPSVTKEYSSVLWWVIAVIFLFVALGTWRYLSVRKTRRKIARYVDAQEEADEVATEPTATADANKPNDSDEL